MMPTNIFAVVRPTSEGMTKTFSVGLNTVKHFFLLYIMYATTVRATIVCLPSHLNSSSSILFPDITLGTVRFYCKIEKVSNTQVKFTSVSTNHFSDVNIAYTLYGF